MPDPTPDPADAFEPTRAELLALVRATSDLVLVVDRDGRYVRVGPGARESLYRPARDLVGHCFAEVLPADAAAHFLAVVRQAIDGGVPEELEYPLDVGGATHWFRATVAPTGEGTAVWVARDVTEGRAAEATRRASEETFRTLAEHSTDLIGLHGPDGRYEYVSPSVAQLLERSPEELLGTDPFALLHPDDAPRVRREALEVALVGLQPPPAVYRVATTSGEYVWFETVLQPIRGADGAVVRLLSSSRDISQRRESEEALAAAALRDDLTGAFNRRGFLAQAEGAIASARQAGRGVMLVCVDVDDLKPINDRHGHDAGDVALRSAAALLRAAVRDGDVLGRLGGDEFAMLLTAPAAGSRAEASFERRIRERLAGGLAEHDAERRAAGRPWALGLSAGVATLAAVPPDARPADTLAALLREADRRLYDDKRGRKGGEPLGASVG